VWQPNPGPSCATYSLLLCLRCTGECSVCFCLCGCVCVCIFSSRGFFLVLPVSCVPRDSSTACSFFIACASTTPSLHQLRSPVRPYWGYLLVDERKTKILTVLGRVGGACGSFPAPRHFQSLAYWNTPAPLQTPPAHRHHCAIKGCHPAQD